MTDQTPPRSTDRAILLIVAGAVVLVYVPVRVFTDLGSFARIGVSLVVGGALAVGLVAALLRRR